MRMNEHPQQEKVPMLVKNSSRAVRALSLIGITSGYIFGPMLLLGGIGWWVGERLDSRIPIFIGLAVALISSNVLLFMNIERHVKSVLYTDKTDNTDNP